MRLGVTAGVLAGLLAVSPAHAGDAAAGREKAQMCQACHGLDGMAKTPDSPNLAGQNEYYLKKALKDFKKGIRQSEQMSVVAPALEDADIDDLAAYYASIKITVTPP